MQSNGQRTKVAVFASGSGSNLQALMDYERSHAEWPASISIVVSDKPTCRAVERARAVGIPAWARSPREFVDKAAYEWSILQVLRDAEVEWLLLAGYMRLIGNTLLTAYPQRILNIHPSLLPMFPGRTPVQDALKAGVESTGVTVHYVDEGIDTGPIILQRQVPIDPDMTEDALLERIHKVEHEIYPAAVQTAIQTATAPKEWKR